MIDNLVVLLDVAAAPGLRHQIDAFGGAAHKNDFLGRSSAEELLHLFPRIFIGVSGACRERVRTPVDVRIFMRVEICQPVDHGLRLLSGGRVVQPDQRPPIHLLLQNGKIAPDEIRIERVKLAAEHRHVFRPHIDRQQFQIDRHRRQRLCARLSCQCLADKIQRVGMQRRRARGQQRGRIGAKGQPIERLWGA